MQYFANVKLYSVIMAAILDGGLQLFGSGPHKDLSKSKMFQNQFKHVKRDLDRSIYQSKSKWDWSYTENFIHEGSS